MATEEKEIPVYLFTGFLESGKTKFIQETLEDPRFCQGENTLLLVTEEGEEEYHRSKFIDPNTYIEVVEEECELNTDRMNELLAKHNAVRVIVEYNGMWDLNTLFQNMPEDWVVYQEFCFADATTFLTYNQNMRQQVYNKLQTCDMIIFNRYVDTIPQIELHKIVRAVNRRAEIAYERPDHSVIPDTIKDPLPFDVNAPVVEIADKDYAVWYRDMDEEMDKYNGKTVKVKVYTANSVKLPQNTFVVGREVMTCCEADIQMAGLACEYDGPKPTPLSWVTLTAEIAVKKSKAYGRETGPVLVVKTIEPAEEPEQKVTTFY